MCNTLHVGETVKRCQAKLCPVIIIIAYLTILYTIVWLCHLPIYIQHLTLTWAQYISYHCNVRGTRITN